MAIAIWSAKSLLQQSNQAHAQPRSPRTKGKSDLLRNWYGFVQFNLELIETFVLETCGQITEENKIRLDLIELYRPMKKPIMGSGLHPSSKWRQVISRRHGPQTQLAHAQIHGDR